MTAGLAGALVALALFAPPVLAQAADSTARPPVRRPGLTSWTTDRRDFKAGDVITILVDELTIASADMVNADESTRDTQGDVGGGANLPGTAQTGDVTFRTRLNTESAARGQARRRDLLTTEVSGRVVAVEPGGMLKVEGTRSLKLEKNEQVVTIAGFARPEDISPRNVIESWRLADATLVYSSKGNLGKPKKGIFGRILGILWP
jgi:flagellar L-ring protein precursor FlgH